MDIGREIVASALRERTLLPFLDAGLNDAWLTSKTDFSRAAILDGQDLDAYQTLLDHWNRHGKVPTVELFERSFPAVAYRLPDSSYTPAELIAIFHADRKRYLAQLAASDIAELLDKERVDDALSLMDAYREMIGSRGSGSRPYRKVTLAELDDLPQPKPLIEDILDAGTVTMLSGPFSTGKSFIALDWALSIASGTDWLGNQVRQGRVLYVSAEGAHGQAKRVRAWKSEHPKARPDDNFAMIINPVQLGERDHVDALLEDAKEADVVIIDTVARCSVGLEENSARDMGQFIDSLYKLRDARSECGTTVIAVHHTGHDKSRARGSSALPAGFDSVFITESADPHTEITMRSVKRKDGPPPAPVSMRLVESGDSVVIEEIECPLDSGRKFGDRAQVLIDWLSENEWHSTRDTAASVGISKSALDRLLKDLVGQGRIIKTPGGGYEVPLSH